VQIGVQEKVSSVKKNRKKFKAHLVSKGYLQQKGVDYEEIFFPVIRHISIIAVLVLVAHYDMAFVTPRYLN
jgi:hypothetical protein